MMLARIERILSRAEKIFGVKPTHLNLQELEVLDRIDLLELLRGKSVRKENFDLLPIFKEKQLVGALNIPKIPGTKSLELGSLLRSIIETSDVQDAKLKEIKTTEMLQRRLDDKYDNVVSIKSFRQQRDNADTDFDLDEPKSEKLNFPFVIEALELNDAFCMAVNIHELSGRFAFLTVDNLSRAAFDSADEYEKLGGITIFIDNLEALDIELQAQIAKLIAQTRTKRAPQIILGTDQSLSAMKANPSIENELLDQLMVGYLHMDQPFAAYKNRDLMQFFVDSISGRLTPQS